MIVLVDVVIKGNLLTVALPVANVTWESPNEELGCIYATFPDLYVDPAGSIPADRFQDWSFAFKFSELSPNAVSASSAVASSPDAGFVSYMGGALFSDPVPSDAASTATACRCNTVSIRDPQGDNQGATTQVRGGGAGCLHARHAAWNV